MASKYFTHHLRKEAILERIAENEVDRFYLENIDESEDYFSMNLTTIGSENSSLLKSKKSKQKTLESTNKELSELIEEVFSQNYSVPFLLMDQSSLQYDESNPCYARLDKDPFYDENDVSEKGISVVHAKELIPPVDFCEMFYDRRKFPNRV